MLCRPPELLLHHTHDLKTTSNANSLDHAARWRRSALDRFLHPCNGHATAAHHGSPRAKIFARVGWLVGYGDEQSGAVIELTYNYGVPSYNIGGAFGHIAFAVAVDNAATSCVS